MSMNYKPGKDGKRVKPVLICPPGRTKQSFSKAADINEIVRRYRRTGFLDGVKANPGQFVDVSKIGDFRELVSKVRSATESFEGLPSELRSRFHNDPAELIEFISDDSNREEAVKLGLVPKPVVPEAVKPEVVVPDVKSGAKEVDPPK